MKLLRRDPRAQRGRLDRRHGDGAPPRRLSDAGIDYEIVVVDDASVDGTARSSRTWRSRIPRSAATARHYSRGFGLAVRAGLERFQGDAVAIVMADGSDDPADLVTYYRMLEEGFDCAFGSRFIARRAG